MLERIKNIINKIFKKQKLLTEFNTTQITIQKEDFKEKLKNETKIYNIQQLYERGKISEDDLQIKEIKELIKLYKEQLGINVLN